MRWLPVLLVLPLLACGAPPDVAGELETNAMRVQVECRLTNDDRERLDCLYAQQDCMFACEDRGGVKRFRQFPDAGEPQCLCER